MSDGVIRSSFMSDGVIVKHSIFYGFGQDRTRWFGGFYLSRSLSPRCVWRMYPTRRVNTSLSLRYRRTQHKIEVRSSA